MWAHVVKTVTALSVLPRVPQERSLEIPDPADELARKMIPRPMESEARKVREKIKKNGEVRLLRRVPMETEAGGD